MVEFAGRLSERVCFERRRDVRGIAGEELGDWQVEFERWARVEPVARADRISDAADTRHSLRRWKLTIRTGDDLGLDMRMRWKGLTLNPTGIEFDPAVPGRLVIWAEDAVG